MNHISLFNKLLKLREMSTNYINLRSPHGEAEGVGGGGGGGGGGDFPKERAPPRGPTLTTSFLLGRWVGNEVDLLK